MITDVQISFYCSGGELVPSRLPLRFSDQHDPDDIATRGIKKGKKHGSGFLRLDAPDDVAPEEKIGFISTYLAPVLDGMLDPGFQRWIVATYSCTDQCQVLLEAHELSALQVLRCDSRADVKIVEEEANQPVQTRTTSGPV